MDSKIGDKVYLRRVELNLTLEKLSKISGIDKGYLSKIENNVFSKYSPITINTLSKSLKVNPAWLLGMSDEKDIIKSKIRA